MNDLPIVSRSSGPVGCQLSRRRLVRQAGAGLAILTGLGRQRSDARDAPATPPEEPPFPADVQQGLMAMLQQAVDQQIVPGAVVGIWIPGRGSFVAAAGSGDVARGTPMSTANAFRIGSVTKTFTATAVLQLVDDGALGLDDTIGAYVPNVPNGDRASVRQVLNMTAGIPSYTEDQAFNDAYNADPLMPFTPQDALDIANRRAPNFAPGTNIQYSDTNYIVLGLLIEKVAGLPAREVIADRILGPLGLARTSVPTAPDMPPPFAQGYLLVADAAPGSPPQEVTRSNPDVAGTAGAMVSDLEDLRVWARVLAKGDLLRPDTQRARLDWKPLPGPPGVEVRYGLGVMDLAGFIGHAGAIFGYSAFMGYLPDADATIVVLTNNGSTSDGTAPGLFAFLAQQLFPERFPLPEGSPPAATPAER